jgi:hypothetical protein
MKYIKTLEKYIHTNQDSIDDMNYIEEFANKFEEKFEDRLNIIVSKDAEFRNYLGYGAYKYYSGEIILNNRNIYHKKINIGYKVRIETDINPNGITNENDIGRTFSIGFDINKSKSRNVNKIRHFYGYSRNIDEILEKFDNYIKTTFNIRYLTPEEKEQRKLQRTANKYNL